MSPRPWWEELTVESCGNPEHGPHSPCWKVLDRNRAVVLSGIPRADAQFFAAARGMVAVLQDALEYGGDATWMEDDEVVSLHESIRAVLAKAGVP